MSDGTSYAYERKAKYTDGLVEKDTDKYVQDNSRYLTEQLKKSYSEEDIVSPASAHKSTQELYLENGQKGGVTTNSSNTLPSDNQPSYNRPSEQIQITDTELKTAEKVQINDSSSTLTQVSANTTPTAKKNAVGVTNDKGKSFLSQEYSFQASEEEKAYIPKTVHNCIDVPLVGDAKFNHSRYFHETTNPACAVKHKEISDRFAKVSTVESELEKRGVSAYDFISPLADVAKEDDIGGEMIAGIMTTAEKTYNTIKSANKAKTATTATKAGIETSKAVASSTATTVQSSGVVVSSTASKASTKVLPIPPIVYLWIFVGVVATAILLMIFGLCSFATTQVSFSLGSNEDDVALELTDISTKNNTDLVIWCITAEQNKEGYIYGAFGQVCTLDYLEQQEARYPGDDEAGGAMRIAGERWLGKRVYDCIGLIKAYGWYNANEDYIEYGSNGIVDFSANTIWDYVEDGDFGDIDDIPEIPGIAVCMDGHIGVYIGNGEVIEAQSTETGVVKTQLSNGSWTHWLKIPGIEYPEDNATVPISPTVSSGELNTEVNTDPVIITDPVEK